MLSVANLLEISEPWLQYALRLNLFSQRKEDFVELKDDALKDPKIRGFLQDVSNFHGLIVSGHKNFALPIHKLLFLLELGLDTEIPEIKHAIAEIMTHKDKNGVYLSAVNIPLKLGCDGQDTFGWAMCDAPLLLRALCLAGVDYPKHIKQGVDTLIKTNRQNGFPCAASDQFGKWRGPGRKEDCCPYATLSMLKLLLATPEYRLSSITLDTAKALLDLWQTSRTSHPYMFFMGNDFRKLKVPTLWYDIVSVCDALSSVVGIHDDERFKEMLQVIRDKQNADGMFTPESIYLKLKEWDFGQKINPSPYLTYVICRLFKQIEG